MNTKLGLVTDVTSGSRRPKEDSAGDGEKTPIAVTNEDFWLLSNPSAHLLNGRCIPLLGTLGTPLRNTLRNTLRDTPLVALRNTLRKALRKACLSTAGGAVPIDSGRCPRLETAKRTVADLPISLVEAGITSSYRPACPGGRPALFATAVNRNRAILPIAKQNRNCGPEIRGREFQFKVF